MIFLEFINGTGFSFTLKRHDFLLNNYNYKIMIQLCLNEIKYLFKYYVIKI